MGGPAKLDGKAVEGVRIFSGGKIGEGAELGQELEKGIACREDILPMFGMSGTGLRIRKFVRLAMSFLDASTNSLDTEKHNTCRL